HDEHGAVAAVASGVESREVVARELAHGRGRAGERQAVAVAGRIGGGEERGVRERGGVLLVLEQRVEAFLALALELGGVQVRAVDYRGEQPQRGGESRRQHVQRER